MLLPYIQVATFAQIPERNGRVPESYRAQREAKQRVSGDVSASQMSPAPISGGQPDRANCVLQVRKYDDWKGEGSGFMGCNREGVRLA